MSKACSKCGEIKDKTEFHRNKRSTDGLVSQCKTCRNAYVAAYHKKTGYRANSDYLKSAKGHKAHLKANKAYFSKTSSRIKNRDIKYSSITNFFNYKLTNIIARKKWEVNIDVDFLIDMFKSQNGRCAISNIEMSHSHRDLKCCSIDRIDSKIGYLRDNIQLVCRAINMGKQNFSNTEMIRFIEEVVKNGQNIIDG